MIDSLYIREGVDIYLTGSNGTMLSSDLATLLTGRYVEIKMLPLSFAEFVEGSHAAGALGEQYAAAWLEEHGWTTLSRNWHTRYGELDIVMLNPEYTVVFVEVKSRRSMHYGYPQEAITPAKQHNLRKAACDWLLDRRNRVPHSAVRFDVVTIVLRVGRPLVHHIENAF